MNKINANCNDRKRYIDIHRNTFVFLNHMLKTHLKTPFIKSMTKAEVIHLHKLTRKRKTGKPVFSFFKAYRQKLGGPLLNFPFP